MKFAQIAGLGENITHLPFWRIRAEISGLELNSYADLISVANLPKAIQNDWHDIAFRFWIPAFKLRPRIFLRLASQITVVQPQDDLVPKFPDGGIHASNLPVEEAIECLKLTLASLMKPRKILAEKLPQIEATPKSVSLVFLPFNESHHEFIQPDYQIAINKNVMSLSKNL